MPPCRRGVVSVSAVPTCRVCDVLTRVVGAARAAPGRPAPPPPAPAPAPAPPALPPRGRRRQDGGAVGARGGLAACHAADRVRRHVPHRRAGERAPARHGGAQRAALRDAAGAPLPARRMCEDLRHRRAAVLGGRRPPAARPPRALLRARPRDLRRRRARALLAPY